MATPKETIWEIEPHTIAKHKILENYLKAWFPIIGRYNDTVNYVDGFAGPGIYSQGEPGSPIVAMKVANEHSAELNGKLNFLFIEEGEARAENLSNEITKLRLKNNFNVKVVNNKFYDTIDSILKSFGKEGKILAPTFIFIDPFGFSGIPASVIADLLKNPKVEVFINFSVDSINRFIGTEDANKHIAELFGAEEVIELIKSSKDNRIRDLRDLYQLVLNEHAKFVRYFEMRNNDGRIIYYLFFCGNHNLGHLRMKEAMWRVSKEGDFSFSDSTNPNQIVLFTKEDFGEEVFRIIKDKFAALELEVDVEEIKKYVEDETAFLDKHLTQALKFGENGELIQVNELKRDGSKRRKGTFPNGTLIKIL
jgi:three-Cys-motif partner protein